MKYFTDTEFISWFRNPLFGKKRHVLDMISIGIVAEDGREYYAISSDYDPTKADDWVKENVIKPLYQETVPGEMKHMYTMYDFHRYFGKSEDTIAEEIIAFVNPGLNIPVELMQGEEKRYQSPEWNLINIHEAIDIDGIYVARPTFYGYYSDYDWVILAALFGKMIELPKGFPMYCNDLKQTLDEVAIKNYSSSFPVGTPMNGKMDDALLNIKSSQGYPKQIAGEHLSIYDARFNRDLYKFLIRAKKGAVGQCANENG